LVVGAVVLPLTMLGVWLARSAQRAATTLVATQLDSLVARGVGSVTVTWSNASSDVRLLAENAPVAAAMSAASPPASPPPYVDEALATMPTITNVVFLDHTGAVRWLVNDDMSLSANGHAVPAAGFIMRAAVPGVGGAKPVGEVQARVSAAALLPPEVTSGPAQALIAVYDRAAHTWAGSVSMPAALLEKDHFAWNGEHWLVARRSMQDPALMVVAAAPLDPVARPFARSANVGIAALAVVSLGVVLLAAVGARRLTSPLGELAVAADAVARGDFGLALSPRGPSEVARVGQAFNAMRANVREMMAERSRRESLAALGELSATIAHQVRTPLTAIKIDLQRVEELVGGESVDLIGHALAATQRIEDAVGASLSMARTGSARFEPIEVTELLRESAVAATPRASVRNVTIELAEVPHGLIVHGDRPALIQALTNVVINAVDAARQTVRMAARSAETTTIDIIDDGPGISPANLLRVGEPFFSTKVGGTGLGLTIARRILDAHRGRLVVSSDDSNGTRVRLELPA